MQLAGFATKIRSTALESMVLGLLDLGSTRFQSPEWNFLKQLVTVLWSAMHSLFAQQIFYLLSRCYGSFHTRKEYFSLIDKVVRSSLKLSDYTPSEIKHNVPAHQLPWYYQQHLVPTAGWPGSITSYNSHKMITNKISQNFPLILVLMK